MNARTLIGALSLIILALLTWELRWVLLVLFGAVVLAVALDVPISRLRALLPLRRPAALVLVLIVLLLLAWGLVTLVLPELIEQVQQLIALIPALSRRLADLAAGITWLPTLERQLIGSDILEKLQPLGSQLLGMAGGAASSTVQLLLMALLALLMVLDPRSHLRLLVAITPAFYRPRMRELLQACREALGGWLSGMTLSALIVFLTTWAALALLQVPLALLSGMICGLLTFVPTIGPSTASLVPLAVAMLISPSKLLQVLVLRLVLQNAEAFLLTPLLLNRAVNLLPTVALVAQLCLGALLGLPGLLLALPLVVVLQVLCQEVLVRDIMDAWERPEAENQPMVLNLPPAPAGAAPDGRTDGGSTAPGPGR